MLITVYNCLRLMDVCIWGTFSVRQRQIKPFFNAKSMTLLHEALNIVKDNVSILTEMLNYYKPLAQWS